MFRSDPRESVDLGPVDNLLLIRSRVPIKRYVILARGRNDMNLECPNSNWDFRKICKDTIAGIDRRQSLRRIWYAMHSRKAWATQCVFWSVQRDIRQFQSQLLLADQSRIALCVDDRQCFSWYLTRNSRSAMAEDVGFRHPRAVGHFDN